MKDKVTHNFHIKISFKIFLGLTHIIKDIANKQNVIDVQG